MALFLLACIEFFRHDLEFLPKNLQNIYGISCRES